MYPTLEIYKKHCADLLEIDSNEHDKMITYSEWLKFYKGKKTENDWPEFKEQFIQEQKIMGFTWARAQGYAGPLQLQNVELPPEIGTELAQLAFEEGITTGHFINDILKKYIQELYEYLGHDFTSLSIDSAKDAFKSTVLSGNKVYKCSGYAGVKFKLSTSEYIFHTGKNDRKKEYEFGELIKNSTVGVNFFDDLGLVHLEHVQDGRRSGKYQNVDFQGFKIQKTIDEDYFLMFNFELKPTNKIDSISTAISQAINYKEKANFTYIIIPQFDYETFYDSERFANYLDLCKKNQLGIISVRMTEDNRIEDMLEVLPAEKTEVLDYSDLRKMIETQGYEKCVLCRKIIKNDGKREGCGWRIVFKDANGNEQQKCAKQAWGDSLINALEK